MISRNDINETGCEEKGLEGALVPLHEFSYDNGLMGCVIRWSLEQTDFDGVTASHCVLYCVFYGEYKLCMYLMSLYRAE